MLPLRLAALAFVTLGCSTASTDRPQESAAPSASTPAQTVGFDDVPEGALPEGWRIGGTHQVGPLASWQVALDPSAPTPPHALALTASTHGSEGTFNLCWTDRVTFADGTIEVAFRAVAGEVDQGGGPIWRVQGADDYYVCRANPLESNFRVYYVAGGSRHQLASAPVEIRSGTWHRIRVEHVGNHVACFLDGEKLLEAIDDHLSAPGGVGLWTKADAVTSFDDLRVEPR